jgi:hypothetical protein
MHDRASLFAVLLAMGSVLRAAQPDGSVIDVWEGDLQRIGHLGDAQDDFNLTGHVREWRDLDRLTWYPSANPREWVPLSFRAFRRLVDDGDFNVDLPIARLKPGTNEFTIAAYFRDGRTATRTVKVVRETGDTPLPVQIRWRDVGRPQDVGQIVDGRWRIENGRLRTVQVGYDRVFLIGTRQWRDYEVRTTLTVHALAANPDPRDGGPAVGLILRFAGHVAGGPEHFPSGQPKWGYFPLGAIGLLRWKLNSNDPPRTLYYPNAPGKSIYHESIDYAPGSTYGIRMRCETLPDTADGQGSTRYSFKAWKAGADEPADWSWQHELTSATALRQGGLVLLAHHVDASFGDLMIGGRSEP